MKIAPDSGESGLLLVSAIQSNTISMYFSHLNTINFDEQIDVLPTSIHNDPQDVHMEKDDEEMQDMTTYIQAPKDQPVNLDMSAFNNKPQDVD